MTILEKYNSAKRFSSTSKEQREIFKWYLGQKNKPVIGADTETTGLYFGLSTYLWRDIGPILWNDVKVFGLSLAIERKGTVNLFWGRFDSPLYRKMLTIFADEGTKTFHNARYDIRACSVSGIELNGNLECTYTMSRIYWDRRKKHSLQRLGEILCPELSDWELPIGVEFKRLKKEYKKEGYDDSYVNFSFIPDSLMCPYAQTDAFMSLMLYQYLGGKAQWV